MAKHPLAGSLGGAITTPGATAFFAAAAPVRLGIAMTSLGLVWLVQGETGSFGAAGVVAGGFAISEALLGPLMARLIDRYGQVSVVPWLLGAHGAAIALLIGLATGLGPVWTLVLAAVAAGATVPQIGALSAARWSALLRGGPLLPSAFTLEAMSNATAFLVGPAVTVIVATALWPAAGSTLAAVLIVGGGLVFATLRATAPATYGRAEPGQRRGRLLSGEFVVVLLVNLALGGFFGSMQLSISGFAEDHHIAGSAGVLFSILSAASLLAGVVYGRRRWRTPTSVQLGLLLSFAAIACLPTVVIASPLWLGVALVLPGLAIAPSIVLSSVLVEALVDRDVLTEAFTWTNSASAAGVALAAGSTGHMVEANGSAAGFLVSSIVMSAAAVLVWMNQHRLSIRDREPAAPVP